MISRRGIIGGLVGIIAAPSIVRFASLMPVKAIPKPWMDLVDAYGNVRTFYRDDSALTIEHWLQGRAGSCMKIYDQVGSFDLVASPGRAPTVCPNIANNQIGLQFLNH